MTNGQRRGKRCEEKRAYETKRAAKAFAKRVQTFRERDGSAARGKQRAYRCPECGFWHLSKARSEARAAARKRRHGGGESKP